MKHQEANSETPLPPLGLKEQRERVVPGPVGIHSYGTGSPVSSRDDIAFTKLQPSRERARGIQTRLFSLFYLLISFWPLALALP